MLPKLHRLRRMKDFDILYREGRFVPGRLIQAKVWRIEPAKYPRRAYRPDDLLIGFVVSTKVSKSAVKRNRVKRKMREVVRLLLKEGKIKAGYMMALMAKSEMVGREYGEIEAEIIALLKRARVLN